MEINNVEPDVLHFTSVYVSKIPKTDILWKILPPEFKFKLKQNKTKLNQHPHPHPATSTACDTSSLCVYPYKLITKISLKSYVCK